MKKEQLKYVIVTLDGILFNTYSPFHKKVVDLLKENNLEARDSFFEQYIDGGYQQKERAFIHNARYLVLKETINQLYSDTLSQVEFNNEFLNFYEWMQQNNLQLFLLTSLNKQQAQVLLNKLPNNIQYQDIIYGNEVIEGKSDEYIYTKLIKKHNLSPNQTMAIEASLNGVLASHQAFITNVYIEYYTLRTTRHQKYSLLQFNNLKQLIEELEV